MIPKAYDRTTKTLDGDLLWLKAKAYVKTVFVSGEYEDNLREMVVRKTNTEVHNIFKRATWDMEEVEREHQATDPRLQL